MADPRPDIEPGTDEWPSPSTPPRPEAGAPGGSTPDRHPHREGAAFKEVDETDPVLGGSGAAPREDGEPEPD